MDSLTPSQKGAAAEAGIAAAAIQVGLVVLRPWCEGSRYDLAFDLEPKLVRVQCKWASWRDGVVEANLETSRHTPRGYVRTRYTASEVDAIAVFAAEIRQCYLVPIEHVEGQSCVRLRLAPTRNNQAALVRWASDYELPTALRRYWGVKPPFGEGRSLSLAVP